MTLPKGKNLVVRDAVITAVNTAAFSTTQAVAAWVPEDTEDLQIKVIASDQQGEIQDPGTTEEVYVISVVVRQKVDPLDASESDALSNLVTAILLLIQMHEAFANLDGPVVLIDRRPFPLCSPTVLADTGYFHGVAQLHFRDWVPFGAGSGGTGSNSQTVTPVGSGQYDADDSVQTVGLKVNAGMLSLAVVTLSDTASGSIALTYNGVSMTLDASDSIDSGAVRLKAYLFSLACAAGTHDLVITPAVGVSHHAIMFGALNVVGLTSNVADAGQSNSGDSAAPSSLSTGATGQTTVDQTTVLSLFGIHADLQPASWTWGAQLASNAQDVRDYSLGKLTVLTTGSRALNSVQSTQGVLASLPGIANAIYAALVVAYR